MGTRDSNVIVATKQAAHLISAAALFLLLFFPITLFFHKPVDSGRFYRYTCVRSNKKERRQYHDQDQNEPCNCTTEVSENCLPGYCGLTS